jgi:O-antigen/teichoic acid export membrane protein
LRLAVLGVGLLVLGPHYGVTGVALAVLLATTAGTSLSLHQVSRLADLGLRTLLLPPLAAATTAVIAGALAGYRLPDDAGLWSRILLPGCAAAVGYGIVVAALRGRPFRDHLRFILRQLRSADRGERV